MDSPSAPLIEAPSLGPFAPDGNWGETARAYLDEGKARLYEAHKSGASGRAVVETYTAMMDHLIRSLFEASSAIYAERFSRLEQRCALVAQGGYGRGELNPCSDIDLLFLCQRTRGAYIENVAERILYTLWDTRLTVGNAMRNVTECVKLAASDLKVKTALLDVRFLCGDEALYREFAHSMENDVLKRGAEKFFQEKRSESAERHERYGDSVYLLEPEIKEGEGGLRDLHTAMWMAKVKFKTNKLPDLVQKGVLTESEKDEIEAARDSLWRVRNALHFLTRQHQDQLRFEYQEVIAEQLGYQESHAKAVEQLMRAYYLNAATINRFADEMMDRCVQPSRSARLFRWTRSREIRPGVTIVGDTLSISGPSLLQDDPVNLIRVFGDAQRHGAELSGSARRIVRAHLDLLDDARRHDPQMVAAFFDILGGRHRVYETLLDMHRVGALGAFLPEFGALLCMVVRDLSHIYTVDQHSLRGVLELERLRAGTYKNMAPLLTQVMREIDNVEIVYLSLLLHDIGKGFGNKHSERGAAKIPAIAERLSLNVDDAAQLEFLVAQHLTMSHLAQRRDIHDPRLIVEFARQVDNADNLKKLYVMTFADMRAVAPKVWNNWHDMLLGELYLQTLDVFEREAFVVESHAARLRRVKERVLAAATDLAPPDKVRAFLGDMPDRYFLGTLEENILHHIELVRRLEEGPLVSEVRHEPEREFSEFTVLAADRPGLFAKLAGVLLAHGMNVLSASINTSLSGMALDIFRISHDDAPEVAMRPERWERLQQTLERVLCSGEDIESLVARAEPPLLRRRYTPRAASEVEVDNDLSDHFTVLDVYSPDRVGLLFAIANALYHLDLSIHLAKITTNVDQVLDVFYVTDAAGRKIQDEARLAEIRNELLTRLTEGQAQAAASA